ncbi:MAG TPA: hypothetical protein VD968_04260, partial [Pyrinomonadaceae bacterium]|nr:hypothetical protein [Pyrinomonadaceae bacterium]
TLLLLLASAPYVVADIARPAESKPDYNRVRADLPRRYMLIESRPEAREARLRVPRSLLEELAPASSQATGGAAIFGATPARTVVAGVFLSLSLALAGMLLARSRRQAVGRVAVVAIGSLACAAAFAVGALANVGPPPRPNALDPQTLVKAVSAGATISGDVRVEIVEDGDELKLVVPTRNRARGDDE